MGVGEHLCVAAALFVLGLCCVLAPRSRLRAWLGIELMLAASVLDFVALQRDGSGVPALVVIALAAAEAVIALALARSTLRRSDEG